MKNCNIEYDYLGPPRTSSGNETWPIRLSALVLVVRQPHWGSPNQHKSTCYSLAIRQTMCRKDSANKFAVRILITFAMFMAKKFSTSLSFLVDTLYNKKISINCSPQDRNFTTSTADGEKHHICQFYLKKVFARVHNKAHSPRSLSHRRY